MQHLSEHIVSSNSTHLESIYGYESFSIKMRISEHKTWEFLNIKTIQHLSKVYPHLECTNENWGKRVFHRLFKRRYVFDRSVKKYWCTNLRERGKHELVWTEVARYVIVKLFVITSFFMRNTMKVEDNRMCFKTEDWIKRGKYQIATNPRA